MKSLPASLHWSPAMSHQPPANLRYLKARLRPLLRPQVWGTIIFLLVVSTVAGIYFANLEEFMAEENQGTPTLNSNNNAEDDQAPESSISAEDRAIAADIDVSTVLENDLAANSETLETAPEKERGNLFDEFMKQRQARNKAANSSEGQPNQQPAAVNPDDNNPFTIKFPTANNAGRNNAATSTNPFLSNLPNNNPAGFNLPDSTNSNNANALQTALNRANGYNQTNLDANGNEKNALQAAVDRLNTPTNNPNNATNTSQATTTNNPNNNNINLIRQPEQLNPLLGTTPYNPGLNTTVPMNGIPVQGTIPLSPYSNVPYTPLPGQLNTPVSPNGYNPGLTNNPPNSYTYINQPLNQPVTPVVPPAAQINPATVPAVPSTTNSNFYNSNLPNPGAQPMPNQVQTTSPAFSVPSNIPGRNIGGGQINTFSNP